MKIGGSKPEGARSDDGFTPPNVLKVSPSALELARSLTETAKGVQPHDWVVTFDWATSVSIKRGPNQPSEMVDDCLMLGAYQRRQIPTGFTQAIDGVEFAIKIPKDIWEKSAQRLIDTDPTKFFKLTLR
jgi:hypothetical protein